MRVMHAASKAAGQQWRARGVSAIAKDGSGRWWWIEGGSRWGGAIEERCKGKGSEDWWRAVIEWRECQEIG